MSDPDPADVWAALRIDLTSALAGASRVSVLVPDWPPVDLTEGLRWAEQRVMNGWYVAHMVERPAAGEAVVWFKYWEYGDSEPEWAAIRAKRS